MAEHTDRELLGRIDERTELLASSITAIDERTKRLEKVLLIGNGQPSILTRVDVVEHDLKKMEKDVEGTRLDMNAIRGDLDEWLVVCRGCGLVSIRSKFMSILIKVGIVVIVAMMAIHFNEILNVMVRYVN